MVVCTFNPNTKRQRQVDFQKPEARLVYGSRLWASQGYIGRTHLKNKTKQNWLQSLYIIYARIFVVF